MKSKSIVIISILIVLYMIWITPVKGAIEYVEKIASDDTYVNQASPNQIYCYQPFLAIGNVSSHFYETYLHFWIKDRPENWTSASFQFQISFISAPLDLIIGIETDGYWHETNLTWNNRPLGLPTFTTLTISEEKLYSIDISSYIEGIPADFPSQYPYITIRLKASDVNQTGFALAWSRDAGNETTSPKLVWTFGEPDEYNIVPSYEMGIVIGSIIGITIILISRKYLRNYKAKIKYN